MNLKQPKIRSEKHRRFVASLHCMMCKKQGKTQAAHIRWQNGGGTGLKPCDSQVVPLCVDCHVEQHKIGEIKFWGKGLNRAKKIASKLYEISGEKDLALWIIFAYNRGK